MSHDMAFDEKGSVKAKPSKDKTGPTKENGPLTRGQAQSDLNAGTLQQMQRTMGNQAVQRILAQRSGEGEAEVDESTAATINSRRGQGTSVDSATAERAGATMGQDVSGARVHTDSTADTLNQQLNAKAFTVGSDIFFRSGEYNPGSNDGQRLLAHELTHVVHQGGASAGVQAKMTVNDPNDAYEKEADAVADTVMSKQEETAQRQPMEEEEEMLQPKLADTAQRQEEEELAMPKLADTAQRQEEEELAMPKLADTAQRQEEEELAMPKLVDTAQRQEVPEEREEEAQRKESDGIQRQEELPEEEL